jgi:hypothetical protein
MKLGLDNFVFRNQPLQVLEHRKTSIIKNFFFLQIYVVLGFVRVK